MFVETNRKKEMKKLALMIVLIAASLVSAQAQIAPGMKYKDLKGLYNPKEYIPESTDPYSRGWAGVASFVIPGLGQVIDGEVGRGLLFFGGNVALNIVARGQLQRFSDSVVTDSSGQVTGYKDEAAARSSARNVILIGASALALNIWSIVDAVRVAKVKNMYTQDLRRQRSSVDFDFAPFFTYAPSELTASGSSLTPTAGMSLRVSF